MPELRFWLALGCLLACLLAGGCLERGQEAGVVARVNGRPIALESLQACVDARSPDFALGSGVSLEEMQDQYGQALLTLIARSLMEQELEKRGLAVSGEELERACAGARQDSGEEDFTHFLANALLSEKDWRELMRQSLVEKAFEQKVLMRGVVIERAALEEFYREHEADFVLPKTLDLCFFSAASQEELARDLEAFAGAEDGPGLALCVHVTAESLPAAWRKEAAALRPGACAGPRQENGEWQGLCLRGRRQAGQLGLAETYPLVESILLERFRREAYEKWLEQALRTARISVAPPLVPILLRLGQGGGSAG